MNALVIGLFVGVFASEYAVNELRIANQYFSLLPELFSGIAVLALLKYLFAGRRWAIDWRYVLFLVLYLFVVVFGFLAQAMPPGAIVSGLRNYLKFLPFFLLPTVYPFTKRQLTVQLGVLFTLLAVQSPLAVYQRFVQYADKMHSGDPIRGLTTSSGVLSVLMCAAVAVVVSMYLRRMIRFRTMVVLTGVFVVPTMLNETKVTLFLLPIAMLFPAFLMPRGSKVWRRMLPIGVVGTVALLAFITVYNYLIVNSQYGATIESFLTEGEARSYLYTGAADGEDRVIGRFDSIVMAVRQLSDDPLEFAFGLGAGNVTLAPLPQFDGAYAAYFTRFGVDQTQITRFLWEIGIAGIVLFLSFCWCVFRDARALAREPGTVGLLGQSWATVLVMVVMTLVYVSIFAINEIAYFFWFYSGVVASTVVRLRRAARQEAAVAAAAAPPPRWAAAARWDETAPAR